MLYSLCSPMLTRTNWPTQPRTPVSVSLTHRICFTFLEIKTPPHLPPSLEWMWLFVLLCRLHKTPEQLRAVHRRRWASHGRGTDRDWSLPGCCPRDRSHEGTFHMFLSNILFLLVLLHNTSFLAPFLFASSQSRNTMYHMEYTCSRHSF